MSRHLYEVVRQRAASEPTAIALGSQQGLLWKTVDSQQLLAQVDLIAAELAARGVQTGDRVITWLPSTWLTPVYLFAIWKLGAIVVPFDREMNPDAAARIVQRVEPSLIVVDADDPPTWAPGDLTVTWWEPGAHSGHRTPHPNPLPEGEGAISPSPAHRDVGPAGRDYRASHDIAADVRAAPRRGRGWGISS